MAGVSLMGGVGQYFSGASLPARAWDGIDGDISLAHRWDDGTLEIDGQVHVPHIVGAAGNTYWVPERTMGSSRALGSSASEDDHFVQGDREPTEETPIVYAPRQTIAGVVPSAVKLPNFLDHAVPEGEDYVIVQLGAEATGPIVFAKSFSGRPEDVSHTMGLSRSASRFARANYHGLDLTDHDLSGVILDGADLSHTILSGVNLSAHDLSHTDLHGACLKGALLTGEQAKMLAARGLDVSRAVIVNEG